MPENAPPPIVGTSLEDDGATPAPSITHPAPTTTDAAPPAPPPDEAEVELNGQRLVPVTALQKERSTARQYREAYEALQPQIQAAREIAVYVQENRDAIEAGRGGRPPAPAAPATSEPDPQLVALAKSLDLYDAQGQPNVAAAKTLAGYIDQAAESKARAAVQPIEAQGAAERSKLNFQRALVTVGPNGTKADPQILAQIWQQMPPEHTANEHVAYATLLTALGYQTMTSTAPVAPPAPASEPLITEASGGRTVARVGLSDFDRRIASARGKTEAEYGNLLTGSPRGRDSVLED